MARIGRYVIEKEIGRGAMGVVYLAHDPRLDRKVAIKTYIPPQGLPETEYLEFRERFLREARAAAGLSHPGIVTLFDVDEDAEGGQLFLAMEWVPGRNLHRVLEEQGPVEAHRVFAMAGVLSDALDMAHSKGIIHRDLKPANILIRESDGAVKLADFGVAHLVGSELTRTDASVGSPAYMSPEQVLGHSIDGRSDLFSLAIVLYEAFCGVRPFSATESVALAHSIAYEEPEAPSRYRSDLMPGLDGFFRRALAKNRVQRFEDGKRFRQALEKVASNACVTQTIDAVDPIPQQAPQGIAIPATLHRWVIGAIAVLLLLAGFVLRPDAGAPETSVEGEPAAAESTPGQPQVAEPGVFVPRDKTLAAPSSGSVAHVDVDGRSMVPQGRLTLLVDGQEAYSRALSRPRAKNVLQRTVNRVPETWGTRLDLPPGTHEISVRIVPDGWETGYEETITAALKAGGTRSLHIVLGPVRRKEISLSMD